MESSVTKPVSKSDSKDNLKSLALPELERENWDRHRRFGHSDSLSATHAVNAY